MNNHTEVEVTEFPKCDICKVEVANNVPGSSLRPASYDGATKNGPWAFMCQSHFARYGMGVGLGKGQKFILKGGEQDASV